MSLENIQKNVYIRGNKFRDSMINFAVNFNVRENLGPYRPLRCLGEPGVYENTINAREAAV